MDAPTFKNVFSVTTEGGSEQQPFCVCPESFVSHSYRNCRGVGVFFPFASPARMLLPVCYASHASLLLGGPSHFPFFNFPFSAWKLRTED